MYWLFLELLCGEFSKDSNKFTISSGRLMGALRIKYLSKLERLIEVWTEIASRFDRDLVKFDAISTQVNGKIYEIECPIILELMGKEFSRTRQRSGKAPPKKEEERIENKNKSIIEVEGKKPSTSKKKGRSDSDKEKARQVKQAYIKTFTARYGINPVFSAREHTLVYSLITSVGFEEALSLAGLYPNYNDPWHVSQKHSFGLLLIQLNKARVELRDPRRMLDSKRAAENLNEAMETIDFDAKRKELERKIELEKQGMICND